MIVPVLWVSRHPEILARGYADQGFLEAMLRRSVWTPSDPITFEHHEVRSDFPDVPGAFVVLPARHHANVEDVRWFTRELDRLEWSVVLLSGDEEWAFPWKNVRETDRRRVWTMQPVPPHARLSGMIPGGWYPGTDTAMAAEREAADDRPLDWFFAGQVTHERRQLCVSQLRVMPKERAVLHETDGYLRGMPQSEYWHLMAGTKVVPSPSGPCTVDTARPLEALEAGAIPVVDLLRPKDPQFDYWKLVFGEDCPLPGIRQWSAFPSILDEALEGWPANANRIFAWWQGWKRDITYRLDDQLRDVAETPRQQVEPDDAITVLVTTSPIPSHPWTGVIEETIASVRAQLPRAEILIGIDGVRPEQEHRRDAYDEYTRRLLWLTNNAWSNVLPVLMPEWQHQAATTRHLLELVRTPQVLFVEHDTPLVGHIPWRGISAVVGSGQANVVRFHHETTVLPDHHRVIAGMVDIAHEKTDTGSWTVPLRRTSAWWQRPHLALTRFYREKVMAHFNDDSRTMIEDVLYGVLHTAVADDETAWWDWRVYVYSPPEGDMKRSTHLDGRADDPKYPMWNPAG